MSVFQGASKVTPLKVNHLRGIVTMRLRMLTHHMPNIDRLMLWDVFCGSGENVIDTELVDGSPLAIMDGLRDACAGGFRPHSDKVELHVSDIRPEACASVERILDDKYSMKPDLFAHNSYGGLAKVSVADARDRVEELHAQLRENRRKRAILFIDPNGIVDLPYPQLAGLLSDHSICEQIDVVINVSATALKRMNASKIGQKNVRDWVGRFDNIFADVLGAGVLNDAWIRRPLPSDPFQWCLMVYWSRPFPQHDWRKAGFVKITAPEGQDALARYTHKKAS